MKKGLLFWVIILLITIVSAIFLISEGNPSNFQTKLVQKINYSPCDTPLPYKIGDIDPRFNITKEELAKDIEKAATIWEKADGRDLFTYDPNAELSINMVYDQRQTLNNEIDTIANRLDKDKEKIEPQVAEYDRRSAEFQRKMDALNAKVEEWNQQGGAPKDEYQKILHEQENLKKEADALNQMAQSLNNSAQRYNTQIGKLNQTVTTFNEALAARPEEGLYDGPNQKIYIYFIDSEPELIHTLAHELGHALGMDHNQNKNSILYEKTSETLNPTTEDLAELTKVCAYQNIFDPLINRFKKTPTES